MAKKRKRILPAQLLDMNYNDMVAAVSEMSEKDLEIALEMEIQGKNRSSYIERMHPRITVLRKAREIEEMRAKGANV